MCQQHMIFLPPLKGKREQYYMTMSYSNICNLDLFDYFSNPKDPIYPTPPLGQDITQGQFLSGV